MRWRSKRGLGLAAALAAGVVVVAVLAVRAWVVPALIVGRIEALTGGRAAIRSYWLGPRSAGVVGLTLYEGRGVGSPVWATAARVETDLTIGKVLRGTFAPSRVRLRSPALTIRIGPDGDLLTKVGPPSGGGPAGPLPVAIADDATVTVRQEGRPPMVVSGVTARLGPDRDRLILSVRSNRREWGPFEAHGTFARDLRTGRVDLKSMAPVDVTPEKVRALPFVPPPVWDNVGPTGAVDVRLSVVLDRAKEPAVTVRTEIDLRGTTVTSRTLDLTASRTTGRVVVDGAVVRLEGVAGSAVDGRVTATGTLDFTRTPPAFDVTLGLDGLNVADTPPSWQLGEAGITGRLTGKARLLARLDPKGVDLSGSSGDAVVERGEIEGIPFKSLRLTMSTEGGKPKYDTRGPSAPAPGAAVSRLVAGLIALQASPPPGEPKKEETKKDEPKRPAVRLPKSITTHIELEDVEIAQLVARARFLLGFPFPLPVTGRLTVKADATIPLGKLKDIKGYAFHGDLTVTRASAFRVDLGRLDSRVDLADGVLELKDLRGRLVDRPDGGADNPPGQAPGDVPASGPLPPGGFRGTLRAELDPPGKLTARFEGVDLPLGELAAPALPRPTPLSGRATMSVAASVDLASARDPAAWTVSGTAQSQQIRFRGAALDAVAARFGAKGGRLDVPELTARLGGRPLSARVDAGLKPPYAFRGSLDVTGWDLAEVLAWVPSAPRPAPVAGSVTARAEASGTLQPLAVTTRGAGRFDGFRAGPVALGDVPFSWDTRGQTIPLAVNDARPFGGRLTAAADLPTSPGRPVVGSANLSGIDTARLSEAIPGDRLKLTGRASGTVRFSIPADVSSLDAAVNVTAPDLTVQGLPAEKAHVSVRVRDGAIAYELTADSLGGKVSLKGSIPLPAGGAPGAFLPRLPSPLRTDGELRAVGFGLGPLWKALGMTGAVTGLTGRGAVDANVRTILEGRGAGVYTHGTVELRDLTWGRSAPLGGVRGVLASSPSVWRIDQLRGDLLGGVASGFLWGETPPPTPAGEAGAATPAPAPARRLGFDLRVDRAPLVNVVRVVAPAMAGSGVDGFAGLRMAGTLGAGGRATGELTVDRGRLAGFPLAELRVPGDVIGAGTAAGTLRVRRASARLAGGQVHADAAVRVGGDRAFSTEVNLAGIDLATIIRVETDVARPASGRISGRVSLTGADIARTDRYRGRVQLDLDDASIVSLPVFREIDRFLGSARGGLFEDGDLTGAIANRQIVVEPLTLQGRLAQLHATGTVGFDGQLNLEVLVNTNQIIPETGQALVSAIPGLSAVVGRDREARLRVANYLSNRLLKLRVGGTVRNPSVNADPGIIVAETAVGFFAGVLKLPLGFLK